VEVSLWIEVDLATACAMAVDVPAGGSVTAIAGAPTSVTVSAKKAIAAEPNHLRRAAPPPNDMRGT